MQISVCVAQDSSRDLKICDLSGGFTGADLLFDLNVQSVVYRNDFGCTNVSFCGADIKIQKDGMLTELESLDPVGAGKPMKRDEAIEKANRYGVKIIPCRWVKNSKVINGAPGVRARIVLKDVAVGPKATWSQQTFRLRFVNCWRQTPLW